MLRLLSIEFQKIWLNKASRILLITYFGLLSTIALLSNVDFSFIGIEVKLADMGVFNFPFIWHGNFYLAGILKFFLSIVVVSMVANEYTYGTMKQGLIDGLSKTEFLLSKVYTIMAIIAFSTVFVFIMTLILGYSFSSYTEPEIVFSDMQYIGGYMLQLLEFCCLCLFLAFLIKRSAFALGFMIVLFIGEAILIHSPIQAPKWLSDCFPYEAMYNVIREPATRFNTYQALEKQVSGKTIVRDYDIHLGQILTSLSWSVIFVLMSYRLLRKRDL